ncbi:MAG: cytidine deaminase [Clostridiales bacterium]|nr:cytidine deaminase [Clostridiales bacterium]
MKLTKQDEELIEIAREVVLKNSDIYNDPSMHVGCAVRAKSGKVYIGVNLKTSHSVCAEQVAIGQAYACGERALDSIVAVKMDKEGKTRVVSPCGLCRYIFEKFGLNLNVVVEDIENKKILKVSSDKLLPYPYKREDKLNK